MLTAPETHVPDQSKVDGVPTYFAAVVQGTTPPTIEPTAGLLYLNNAAGVFYYANGTAWNILPGGTGGGGGSTTFTDTITGITYALTVENGQFALTPQ